MQVSILKLDVEVLFIGIQILPNLYLMKKDKQVDPLILG